MRFPDSIVVFGKNPVAAAVCQVLKLYGAKCFAYEFSELTHQHTSAGAVLGKHLRRSPLVLSTMDIHCSTADTIRLVHRLRNDDTLGWEGSFIAIAENRHERDQLAALDLLGDPRGRFRFEEVPGHSAIAQPLRLVDLSRTVIRIEPMYANAWFDCVSESVAGGLAQMLCDAKNLWDKDENSTEAVAAVWQLIDAVAQVDWVSLLPHSEFALPAALKADYSSGNALSAVDSSEIFSRVADILFKANLSRGDEDDAGSGC